MPAAQAVRPGLVEWVVLLLVAWSAIAFAASHALFARIDRTLYDAAMVLWSRPPPPGLVTVVVDDESIAALGRWPWRRGIHATLIDRIAQGRPAAIALDVVISEPDVSDPRGDEALVRAVAAAGNVVLASPIMEAPGAMPRDLAPLDRLREAAALVGHIAVRADDDGLVREVALNAGAQRTRPYLGLAALEVARRSPRWSAAARGLEGTYRDVAWPIPFFGPDPAVERYSYLAVLRGDVAPETFADAIVFIGTAATALGDSHPVPAGGRSGPMAGVEIAAQVAGGLHEGVALRIGGGLQSAFAGGALVLLLLVAYRQLGPRGALAATVASLALVLAGTFVAFRLLAVWLPPSGTLLGVALCYPLWAWRRLEVALHYMRAELDRVRGERAGMPVSPQAEPGPAPSGDPLEATIVALRSAVGLARDARRFIADTVESLPQGLVVSDLAGRIVIANTRSREWAGIAEVGELALLDLLGRFRLAGSLTWQSLVDVALTGEGPSRAEAEGPGGRVVVVLLSPCHRAGGELVGVIANLLDVTERRAAERRREDVLRLLSHDMRAPLASIVTLVEMHSLDPAAGDTPAVLGRVDALARRTLALADDFLGLARAEQAGLEHFRELDLGDVATEACEEVWPLAHARDIRIEREFCEEPALVVGERDLLLRMVLNLLTNAIKFSPRGTVVTVSLQPQSKAWLLRVIDRGRGIAPEEMPRLFTRFGRVGAQKDDPGGVGLGLTMVRAVVERHHGVVSVSSEPGKGSVFSVSLPAASAP